MNMSRKFLIFGYIFFISLKAFSVEGMWMPMFLEEYNIKEMQKLGLKLSAEDIFSTDQPSLKDAVVLFGRGCTGAIISEYGLLITNHHCCYGLLQRHSSVDNDILSNGFWAANNDEEIINPGLTVTIMRNIDEVTNEVLQGVDDSMSERERKDLIAANSAVLIKNANEESGYNSEVRAFYNGNRFFLITYEVFKDIRLVGAPPSSIGKFGGDYDNWMWPRHSGDFALFRIYTAPDGSPAEYSKENIPYEPKRFFTISVAEINKGDFTMVYGYPGTTQQYLPSFAVQQLQDIIYPNRVKIRGIKLNLINEAMESDPKIRLQYTAKASRISNAWKKWKGEIRGLKRLDAVQKKQNYEEYFQKKAESKPEYQKKYGQLLALYKEIYRQTEEYSKIFYYFHEAVMGTDAIAFAARVRGIENLVDLSNDDIAEHISTYQFRAEEHFRNYHICTDQKLFAEMTRLYYNDIPKEYHPQMLSKIERYKSEEDPFAAFAKYCFAKSVLTSEEKFYEFLEKLNRRSIRKLKQDPIYKITNEYLQIHRNEIAPVLSQYNLQLDSLHRIYMQGIIEFEKEKTFHPDANSTLRVSYGNIDTYYPADGVKYDYYTSLSGVIEKDDPDNYVFTVPKELKNLYFAEDYGNYAAADGTMRVCFIASNHTTGGNSGSPVINAHGNIIGINFDRNWEGTMSDIMYDPDMNRNISVDMRYVLFIIDKFANAGHLINEMKIQM